MKKYLLIALIALLTSPSFTFAAVVYTCGTAAATDEGDIFGPTSQWIAQSFFTPNDGNQYTLTSVAVGVFQSGGANNVTAYLFAHSGTYGTNSVPTGAHIAASASIAANTFPTFAQALAGTQTTFTFSDNFKMQPNTNYTLVLGADGATNAGWVGATGGCDGNAAASTAGESSWTAEATIDQTPFTINGTVVAPTFQLWPLWLF